MIVNRRPWWAWHLLATLISAYCGGIVAWKLEIFVIATLKGEWDLQTYLFTIVNPSDFSLVAIFFPVILISIIPGAIASIIFIGVVQTYSKKQFYISGILTGMTGAAIISIILSDGKSIFDGHLVIILSSCALAGLLGGGLFRKIAYRRQ